MVILHLFVADFCRVVVVVSLFVVILYRSQ